MGRKFKRARIDQHGVFLYGSINHLRNAKAYCKLHNCFLTAHNIKYKKCNFKKCPHLEEEWSKGEK